MGQVGTLELYTGSGWVEIDLYDPDDFSYTPVEIHVGDGWGAPYLGNPDTADTPIEVYTSQGWLGMNSTGYVMMEDFEGGNLPETTWIESQDTGLEVTSGRAAFQGNYGLKLGADTCERIVSAPDFDDPLPEYPSPGETFDCFVRFDDSNALSNETHVSFGHQNYPSSDGFSDDDVNAGYNLVLDPEYDYFRIAYTDSYGRKYFQDSVAYQFETRQWYRCETDWHETTSDTIYCRLYEVSKDDWEGTQVAEVSYTDSTYGEGAVELASPGTTHMDLLRRTSPL